MGRSRVRTRCVVLVERRAEDNSCVYIVRGSQSRRINTSPIAVAYAEGGGTCCDTTLRERCTSAWRRLLALYATLQVLRACSCVGLLTSAARLSPSLHVRRDGAEGRPSHVGMHAVHGPVSQHALSSPVSMLLSLNRAADADVELNRELEVSSRRRQVRWVT
jgi:hypothetical protein